MKVCFSQLTVLGIAAVATLLTMVVIARPSNAQDTDLFNSRPLGSRTRLELATNNPNRLGSPSRFKEYSSGEDPDLEAGFPVTTFNSLGTYRAGPVIHALVGNIDDDPTLEIVVTALANGPLYAWNSDGSLVAGWPLTTAWGAEYPAMGELYNAFPGFEIVAGHFTFRGLEAYSGSGATLNGWPVSGFWHTSPPSLADVNGDGIDEIFTDAQRGALYAYTADGSPLPGWPAAGGGGDTPAIADLDGDGDLEIVTANSAFHHNGTVVAGFPIQFNSYVQTFPVIGDVDADGKPEIIHLAQSGDPAFYRVYVRSANGTIERTWTTLGNVAYGTQPTLADLDGDSFPEIVIQAPDTLTVLRGDGTPLPGWPVMLKTSASMNSTPIVGDVDGDLQPEIVIETLVPGLVSGHEEVQVYDRHGVLHPRFPKILPLGLGAVPAIADIDLDGHNEIIIAGGSQVWVYDLGLRLCSSVPHGQIEWGQFGAGPRHQGHYVSPTVSTTLMIDTSTSANPLTMGDPLIYTITVTNKVTSTITDLILTDTLPANVIFGSVTSSQGSCSQGGNIISCSLSSLASGNSLTVQVAITSTIPDVLGNAVNVTGSESTQNGVRYTGAQCAITTVKPRELYLPMVVKGN